MKRVPLILIAGFLGAGKTTFLRSLMSALKENGTGFSVIVNDFENAEVDAVRLRTLEAEVHALNGSCVCCSSLHDFMALLGDIPVPKGSVLLVEVNGASDLLSLIAAITVRHECQRFTSPLQVTLLDAKRWQTRGEQNELEREQALTSTHWQLTHAQEVTPTVLEQRGADIRTLCPRARETDAATLAADLHLLAATSCWANAPASPPPLADPALATSSPVPHHHHEGARAFTSMQVQVPFVVKRRDLELTLAALPESVIRVKGLCRLAELPQVPMSFQHVRPQAETWFLPMIQARSITPIGVVIGVGLPETAITAQFQALPSAELTPGFDPNDW